LKYFRKASDFEEHSSKSFNLVVMTTLKYAPIVLNHHLAEKNPSTHKKWKTLRIKVKQLLKNITVLIEKLDPTMKKFVLKQSELLTHYFNCFPKIGKDYLKILVQCWNTENEELKIVSFLCIRKLARDHPNPYLNLAFKSTFKTFMNSCRQTTAHSWTQLSFMSNCIVELGGLSLPATYQHTFVYLRQLAIKLRQASTARTKENFKLIYNWQFLHAVRLWTNLLCAYCNNDTDKNDVLKPLIYPLVQIMIGIMR
jgi:nucleolar complex protein 2